MRIEALWCAVFTIQYNLLNSSNKRACSNRFVNVTIVSSKLVVSNNSGQKLKENVKRDKRKLVKHLRKKQSKNEKNEKKTTKNFYEINLELARLRSRSCGATKRRWYGGCRR